MSTSTTYRPRSLRRIAGTVVVSALAVMAGSMPAFGLPAGTIDPGNIDDPGTVISRPPPTTTPTTLPPASDFTIKGAVYIGGLPVFTTGDGPAPAAPLPCNATPGQVTMTAVRAGVTKTVKPVAPIRSTFYGSGWSYQFTGLTRGTWTVTARMDPGVCTYGKWVPVSRAVSPPTSGDNPVAVNADFSYHMPTKVTRVNGNIAAGLMESALASTQLHLDNFGPQHGLSHHEANASFLQWGGSTTTFTVPEKQYDLDCGLPCPDAGQARLYVNDVNLNSVDVAWDSAFVLDAGFEESGREVKGFQSYDSYWDYLDFVTDDTIPDFEISNANLRLRLMPVADGAGRLTYSLASSDFTGTIQGTGGCDVFGVDVCEFAIGYKGTLESAIESNVSGVLNSSTAKAAVGNALKPQLANLGINTVSAVYLEGDDIVIAS